MTSTVRIPPILMHRRGPALVLAINRPDDRNRIDSAAMAALTAGLDAADADPTVRAIVITGSRAFFCSGGRIDGHPNGSVPQQLAFAQSFCTLRQRMARTLAPIVAAVEGPCIAGGMAVLAACDLAIAADDVPFSFPEINFGLFPLLAMAAVHPILPSKTAFELFYTGRDISAAEARDLHVVNRIVPPAAFWPAVDALVEELAAKDPTALAIGRKAYNAMAPMPPAAQLDYAQTALATLLAASSGAVPH